VTRITADPTNAATVYATLSGFSLDEYAAHVYRSVDSGNTWTPIDGNLPDIPANDILVDPNDTNRLYLANDVGVYTSRASGRVVPAGLATAGAGGRSLHNARAPDRGDAWPLAMDARSPRSAGNVGPAPTPAHLALSAGAQSEPPRGSLRARPDFRRAGAGRGVRRDGRR
jgi:hypothetical protein